MGIRKWWRRSWSSGFAQANVLWLCVVALMVGAIAALTTTYVVTRIIEQPEPLPLMPPPSSSTMDTGLDEPVRTTSPSRGQDSPSSAPRASQGVPTAPQGPVTTLGSPKTPATTTTGLPPPITSPPVVTPSAGTQGEQPPFEVPPVDNPGKGPPIIPPPFQEIIDGVRETVRDISEDLPEVRRGFHSKVEGITERVCNIVGNCHKNHP